MAKRSLRASTAGIRKAKQHFAARNWTQEFLAAEVGVKTRQPIWRFFAGQAIERFTFFEICTTLDLDWREIALEPPTESRLEVEAEEDANLTTTKLDLKVATLSLDDLVKTVRSQWHEKINHQCGTLQPLNVNRPVAIDKIYVDVCVYQQMDVQNFVDTSETESLTIEDIDISSLDKISQRKITGIEAAEKYSSLRLLGKPGSGKSTFLKYLAMQCNRERFAVGYVPILIMLRDFAASYLDNPQINFLEYIHQEFFTAGLSDPTVIMNLLQGGRILLMIDGLDEVGIEAENIVLNQVRRFFEKYYRNKFVVSCRTAIEKLALKGFTDIQMAPFNESQISTFTHKCFGEFGTFDGLDVQKNSSEFVEKMKLPENKRIRRLATTPLFLHLACSTFYRADKFATRQVEFFKQALDLLLGKWDEARGIQRDEVYAGFDLSKRISYACELAFETFTNGQYFFDEDLLEKFTVNFIKSQVDVSIDPEEIYQATDAVIRSLKSQYYHGLLSQRERGIFSFTYLALQEYLIARMIAVNCNIQPSEHCLDELISHISDPSWREIFLLTVSMISNADDLLRLMNQKIEEIVSQDSNLKYFLIGLNRKANLKQFLIGLDRKSQIDLTPNYAAWVKMLQKAIVTQQDSEKWKFSTAEKQALQSYADANQLLLDCLNSNCEVSPSIREEIEKKSSFGLCDLAQSHIDLNNYGGYGGALLPN